MCVEMDCVVKRKDKGPDTSLKYSITQTYAFICGLCEFSNRIPSANSQALYNVLVVFD